jgi:phosphatidylserine/phosphatidylglycerophosphate/cardiolipin synthase-like enzyme
LWLRHLENNIDEGTGKDLSAAIVGSSNFGERSFKRDMESNIILVFPPHTRNDEDLKTNSNVMQSSLNEEWSEMISSSRKVDPNKVAEEAPPLPWNVRFLLPFIKTFF